MGAWAALLMATPIFGFQLTPPMGGPVVPGTAQLGAKPQPQLTVAAAPAETPSAGEAAEAAGQGGDADEAGGDDFAEQMARRAEIAEIHKPLGIATWASMTLTLGLGVIQYYNLYGGSRGSNPCVQGDAVFGQGQCSGTPWLHLTSALATTVLYSATFTLSFVMPDPGGLDEGDSDYAKNLRTHKALRWVHFGGMLAQILLGAIVANGQRFGLDRANDYGTLKALSTVHLAIGGITWGALTWAGSTMLF